MSSSHATPDWSTIPAPEDDGGARHLPGLRLPALALPATDGTAVDLSALPGRTVVYAYPRTGRPEHGSPEGWDAIPGARGCTPQSCAFRDHYTELRAWARMCLACAHKTPPTSRKPWPGCTCPSRCCATPSWPDPRPGPTGVPGRRHDPAQPPDPGAGRQARSRTSSIPYSPRTGAPRTWPRGCPRRRVANLSPRSTASCAVERGLGTCSSPAPCSPALVSGAACRPDAARPQAVRRPPPGMPDRRVCRLRPIGSP